MGKEILTAEGVSEELGKLKAQREKRERLRDEAFKAVESFDANVILRTLVEESERQTRLLESTQSYVEAFEAITARIPHGVQFVIMRNGFPWAYPGKEGKPVYLTNEDGE